MADGGRQRRPVLVAVDEDRIVGALGPVEIMSDSDGSAQLPPQALPASNAGDTTGPIWRRALHA